MRTAHRRCAATLAAVALPLIIGITNLHAQQPAPIERVTLRDNDLSCAQLHAETVAMERATDEAKKMEADGKTRQTAGTAGNVATEVVSRTGGFFGALGGLAGHVIGTVAGQTASNAAVQSGQSTVQQAQERMRQAAARKEHVTGLFLKRGCKADDLAYNPPPPVGAAHPAEAAAAPVAGAASVAGVPVQVATAAPTVAPAPRVQAAVPVTLPEVDPDAFYKGKTGGTFGKNLTETLPGNRRVAVAGFRVVFVTKDEASAQVRATYLGGGRETSGARSRTTVVLSGVQAQTLQALVDRAYEDFLAQLKLAGREVVPLEEMREMLSGMDATPSSVAAPFAREHGSQIGAVFSPAALPLWFDHLDGPWSPKGPFDQTNWRRVNDYATKMNAIIVAPLIVVHFARLESSGNRSAFTARSAETDAHIGMHIPWTHSRVIRAEESRSGLVMKGDDGVARLEQHISTQREFGEIRVATASNNASTVGVMDSISRSLGSTSSGLARSVKVDKVADTSDERYVAAAGEVIGQATGTLAKWFQKHAAR